MTICCVWCEIGKPNNEKQWKTAFTKDTLKLLNWLTIYYIYILLIRLKLQDSFLQGSWLDIAEELGWMEVCFTSVSSHYSICFIPCAPNEFNILDDQIWSSLRWPTQSPIRACVLLISHAAHASAKSEFWTKKGLSCFNSIDKFMTGWGVCKTPSNLTNMLNIF